MAAGQLKGGLQEVAAGLWQMTLPRPGSFLKGTNVYLLRDGGDCALIDAGEDTPLAWEALVDAFASLNAEVAEVRDVFLTHAHRDHLGLVARIRELSGTRVWLHPADVEFATQRLARVDSYATLCRQWLLEHGMSETDADGIVAATRASVVPTMSLDGVSLLEEGARHQVGRYSLEVRWTPGHTPGHVCFFDREQGVLFSGDHVLPDVSTHVGVEPYSPANPLARHLQSLRELASANRDVRRTLPGHGAPMGHVATRAGELLRHQLARQSAIRGLLDEGALTAVEVATTLWAETRPYNWQTFQPYLRRNVVSQIVAHLELLCDEGLATRLGGWPARYTRRDSALDPTRS